MSQFALRLPNSLHGHTKEVARQDETSLNQFIVTAVAEKLSAMCAEEFFQERAAKAKPSRLGKIPAKVPDTSNCQKHVMWVGFHVAWIFCIHNNLKRKPSFLSDPRSWTTK